MGIKQQLEQFITLTTLLNEEEATVTQDGISVRKHKHSRNEKGDED